MVSPLTKTEDMCSIPPPPPPLPPAVELRATDQDATKPSSFSDIPDFCKWTSEVELREACIKNKLCLEEPPYKYSYKHFESIPQEGPTCGIVALSMLVNGAKNPSEILTLAKENAYTNNGEMFSCKNMVKLATEVLKELNIENYQIELRNGSLFNDVLVERLLNGSVLLVAYDADGNHTPCLKNGHKAHWSLVCGVLIISNPQESTTTKNPDNIYVLCKHGKSKYLAAWKLDDLNSSNCNLNEFLARKGETMDMYVMPEGGIGGEDGLKSQFIIFDGL